MKIENVIGSVVAIPLCWWLGLDVAFACGFSSGVAASYWIFGGKK